MKRELLMGNEAIAVGAIHAGVNLVTGYPGTPSTEILETVAKRNDGTIYVEWSVNEKAALEVAAGASYSGARTLVTMKQVGLNVASDPLMSLAYVGIKGGMVIVSADDPGPISSQTEQDTRHFAQFSKLPVFDPSSPEEAYEMIKEAFDYSEQYGTPVLFRPTTRVCHACSSITISEEYEKHKVEGFIKDTMRFVIFPRTSYLNHLKIEKRNIELAEVFSNYTRNSVEGVGKKAIATGGISYLYTKEVLQGYGDVTILKIATPHPFPEKLAVQFLSEVEEVMVIEELDPVIEKELVYLCGKYHLNVTIKGKQTGDVQNAGENSVESVKEILDAYLGITQENEDRQEETKVSKELPTRPPVLCAGCPHRASFYAVKQAAKGKKAVYSGDIGCYTLGNAKPLDMVDTCLCMGAGITIAQGLHRMEEDTHNFAFIGDSTFFASGITGVVNAVYNNSDMILVILDNSTTAMTGHQPHPGTGVTMMGDVTSKINIKQVLHGIGIQDIKVVNPFDLSLAVAAVKELMEKRGVRVVIFEAPCVAVEKPKLAMSIQTDACVGCKRCMNELGCPAIYLEDKKARIDSSLCFGCELCVKVCGFDAIKKKGE